jgi:hypothetical protein
MCHKNTQARRETRDNQCSLVGASGREKGIKNTMQHVQSQPEVYSKHKILTINTFYCLQTCRLLLRGGIVQSVPRTPTIFSFTVRPHLSSNLS